MLSEKIAKYSLIRDDKFIEMRKSKKKIFWGAPSFSWAQSVNTFSKNTIADRLERKYLGLNSFDSHQSNPKYLTFNINYHYHLIMYGNFSIDYSRYLGSGYYSTGRLQAQ